MTTIEQIKNEISTSLQPTKEYDNLISKSIESIKNQIKLQKVLASVTIGGSYAKNTHIGNQFDCDIFIRFEDITTYKTILPKILTPIAKELNSTLDLVHGSRDYYQIKYKNLTLEIIPVKNIKDPTEAQHIMDYSPFHVAWVKEQLEKKPLQNDIRIMKKFLKSARIYGAESYVSGFSGHVNDILVLYYGGFEKALTAISKWKTTEKVIIDYSNFYKKMDVKFFMNDSKTISPLIAVDPIDKNRNAAAALNQKCFEKIILKAKEFLKNPTIEYFETENISKQSLTQKYPFFKVISIKITAKDGKTDIVGAKLVKALEYITTRLTTEGFNIIESDFTWDKEKDATFFIIVKEENIQQKYLRKGPSIEMTKAVKAFKEKNKKCKFIEKDNHIYIELNRNNPNVKLAIAQILTEKLIKEKVQESILE